MLLSCFFLMFPHSGKKWHPDHFVCCTCNGPFPNGQFFERDGKPYCERDFYG
jgi:paxillin